MTGVTITCNYTTEERLKNAEIIEETIARITGEGFRIINKEEFIKAKLKEGVGKTEVIEKEGINK